MNLDWIKSADRRTLLGALDVALDVQGEMNLSQEIANIPLFRNPVRFTELYPGESVSIRDAYCDLRFKAAEHMTKTGVFKSVRLPAPRGWDSRLLIEADKSSVDRAVEALRAQVQGGAAKVSDEKEPADEPEKPLQVSKATTALVIETTVSALSRDAIERVMMAIHLEDQYRMQVSALAKRGSGDITDEVIGLGLNRTLIRESISETFYPYFTSNVIQAIFRGRGRAGGRYTRSDFRREFADLAGALDKEELDITNKGELVHTGSKDVGRDEESDRTESPVVQVLSGAQAKAQPRSSLPANQQAALPSETVPIIVRAAAPKSESAKPKPFEEFGREYGKSFANKVGEHSATGAVALIVFLALLAAGWLGLRKQLTTLYESVMHPTAQSDTTKAK